MSHPTPSPANAQTALAEFAIHEGLTRLPEWRYRQNALERVYRASSYLDALHRLNAIAQLSEAANHHPELILGWRLLTIRYWTHTAQGVTELDFELAAQCERCLQ